MGREYLTQEKTVGLNDQVGQSDCVSHSMSFKVANYVVITPVRDEKEHLASTIESMLRQTALPREWVIVDDGSTDGTAKILDDCAARYPWITAVHRPDRGFRKSGGGVVEAFYHGYGALSLNEWDFIVKFDGDLSFEPTYFEACLGEFDQDSKLGIGGGIICYVENGRKVFENTPSFHVRGATKIYRRACWDGIGGLIHAPGWDTFDEVKANSLGWTTKSFPGLHLVHQRVTGAADGHWRTSAKYGRANYICGYHPLFMMAKCIARVPQRPFLIGAIGLLYGFCSGYLTNVKQVDDWRTIAYLRRQQMRRLFGRDTTLR
jgi:poly-beta-1,6-N-acetyl-D-glucosamine synthase